MSAPKPPALASWMVEHLVIGPNREAVAGDLLEQFGRRPSASWYWHQTLAAIGASLWNEWRILLLAASGTVIWRMVLEQFSWSIWSFKQTSGLIFVFWPWAHWGASDFGFWSLLNVLPVLVVLPAYLLAVRNLSLPMLRRGLLVGVLALPLSFIPALAVLATTWRILAPTREMLIQNPLLLPMLRVLAQTMYAVPLFLALLLSMWAARTTTDTSPLLHTKTAE